MTRGKQHCPINEGRLVICATHTLILVDYLSAYWSFEMKCSLPRGDASIDGQPRNVSFDLPTSLQMFPFHFTWRQEHGQAELMPRNF
jgi:hypothetical protein